MKRTWTLAICMLWAVLVRGQHPTAVETVQRQLDAYNKQDITAFADVFASDVALYNNLGDSVPAIVGRQALIERYSQLFKRYPNNKCTLIGRMLQGDVVIDHEWITGRESPLKIIAIYEVKEGLIKRCWFIRSNPS
jgi:hypothetical protein